MNIRHEKQITIKKNQNRIKKRIKMIAMMFYMYAFMIVKIRKIVSFCASIPRATMEYMTQATLIFLLKNSKR